MNKSVLGVVGCAAALFAVAGCTPEARQDVGQAGENVGQATSKSVEGTKEAAGKAADATADAAKAAGKDVANATDKAVDATKDAAADAANATAKTAAKAGAAVTDATKDAAHATEKTVAKAGAAVANAGDTAGLTLKVKNAILVDDSIKSKDVNVDTMADSKMVSITGSVPTAAMKTKAEADAKKALMDAKSDFKVKNQLTVGAAKM